MAYFTYPQEQVLHDLLLAISKERNSVHAAAIQEHDLLEAFQKNAWEETVREDVLLVLENEDKELSDDQLSKVVRYSLNIDMSGYNEAISEIVEMVESGELE